MHCAPARRRAVGAARWRRGPGGRGAARTAYLGGGWGALYDPGVAGDPAGGVPWVFEPDPMLGQFFVEPEPELELELPELPELEELEPEELELPVFPVLELLDDGVVVDEPVPELEPELVLGVELDVVAALATSAPPARSPVVNAPTASTFRRRSCMEDMPFVSGAAPAHSGGTDQRAPRTCGQPQSDVGGWAEFPCESMTILRTRSRAVKAPWFSRACGRANNTSAWAPVAHAGRRKPPNRRGSASSR
jgi:hypothetical protein